MIPSLTLHPAAPGRCQAVTSCPVPGRRGPQKSQPGQDKAMNDDTDLSQLDDPAFLAERRRVREELEHQPEASIELTAQYERLNDEFLRRARIAWGGGGAA